MAKKLNITNEQSFISFIKKLNNAKGTSKQKNILRHIGDDAAVFSNFSNRSVFATDAMVDGFHFHSNNSKWIDIGWKCAVSNLSDIAAMGAVPDYALVTIGVSKNYPKDKYLEFFKGINEALTTYDCEVIGGDIVGTNNIFINIAIIGHIRDKNFLSRNSAQPGDVVYVTGELGGSAGGLDLLLKGEKIKDNYSKNLINRHFRPYPRLDISQNIINENIRCAMDISDGLYTDLEKISIESNVDIKIFLDQVPIDKNLSTHTLEKQIEFSLHGGEDYELIIIGDIDKINSLNKQFNQKGKIIGEIVKKSSAPKITILDKNNNIYKTNHYGWDHLNNG
ncbi:MAG: thiamine-phosphate kinase [Chloroflexi bacterium]|nr:thiamine-phosphate kinase [Chloroflexota bacterium]